MGTTKKNIHKQENKKNPKEVSELNKDGNIYNNLLNIPEIP